MRKYFIILWLVLSSIISSAQIIDTVCVGAIRTYKVQYHLKSTYNWQVNGGNNIISPNGLDSIKINWINIGTFQLIVTETDTNTTCSKDTSAHVLVVPYPVINLGVDTTLCPGESLILDATTPYANYKWQDNSTTPIYTVTYPGGIYWVTVSINNMCSASDTIKVGNRANPPDFYLFQDTILCDGIPINITVPNSTLYYSISWYDGTIDYIHLFNNSGNYYIDLTLPCGLPIKKDFKITYENCECSLYFPSAFTPNGDGINDVFLPVYECELNTYHLYIYNRWGQLLFETSNPQIPWDGKFRNKYVDVGVYNWMIKYSGPHTKGLQGKQGIVTVLK